MSTATETMMRRIRLLRNACNDFGKFSGNKDDHFVQLKDTYKEILESETEIMKDEHIHDQRFVQEQIKALIPYLNECQKILDDVYIRSLDMICEVYDEIMGGYNGPTSTQVAKVRVPECIENLKARIEEWNDKYTDDQREFVLTELASVEKAYELLLKAKA